MSEQDLKIDSTLVVTNGLTVTGGTVDFSGAASGGGIELTALSATTAAAGTTGLAYDNTTGVFTYTPPDLSTYATTSSLSSYATTASLSSYATTASLAAVATSGAYADISGTPSLATVATSGAYSDLTGTPTALTNTDGLTEGSTNLYFTNARASSAITGSDLDMGGNKVLFGNMYSAEGNLPSATTYHGMFAHVHGTGKGYFAHAGNWVKLLDETSSTTTDLTEGTNLYYTDARARASLSASTAAAGTAGLAYDSSTGQFTLTPPDLSSYLTSASLSGYATTASLATVATSGAYSDLSGTPSLSGYLTDITGESLSDLSNVASTTPTDGQVLTYDTTNGWQPETPSSGGSTINWIASNVTSSATAASNGALALGGNSTTGSEALAVGNYAVASGTESVAIGSSNSNTTHLKTNATSAYAIALGHRAQAVGQSAITIGWDATAGTSTKTHAIAIGASTTNAYDKSVALGYTATTTADRQLMLGATGSNGFTSIRVGNTGYTPSDNLDLATKAYVDSASGGGGGTDYLAAEGTNTTAATATGTSAIAGGYEADAGGNYSVSLGYQANAGSTSAISIGYDSNAATGNQTIAIGQSTDATGTYAIAHGLLANAAHNYSAAIGYYATTGQANQLMLGRNSNTNGFTSIRVGNTSYTPTDNMDLATKAYVDANAGGSSGGLGSYGAVNSSGTAASATGTEGIAIGAGATAKITDSIAIGRNAAQDQNAGFSGVSIGLQSYVGSYQGVAIGEYARADGYGVAIGSYSDANNSYSTALGNNAQATAYSCIAMGYNSLASATRSICIGQWTTTGQEGIAIGTGTGNLQRTKASYQAVALGYRANAWNNYAVAIGGYADADGGTYTTALGYATQANGQYAVALGYAAVSSQWQITLGSSNNNSLRCNVTSITSLSDRRDKTEITDLDLGLDFVNAITPKSFYRNERGKYYLPTYTPEQLQADDTLEQSYTFDQASYDMATQKADKKEFGWIAQDVDAQLPAAYSDARLTYNETDDLQDFDVQRFTAGDMLPIAWKALRELSTKHDQLQSDYDALLARVVALENA